MANERLIEVISPQSYEAIEKLKNQLLEAAEAAMKLSKAGAGINLKPSQIQKSYQETASVIKSTQKAVTDYEKSERALENQQKRRMFASSSLNRETQKMRFETQQLNKAAKEQSILTSKIATEYQKIEVRMNAAGRAIQSLVAKKTLNGKLSKQEEAQLKRLQVDYARYNNAIMQADTAIKRHQRNVGNYSSALKGMGINLRMVMSAFGFVGGIYMFANAIKDAFSRIKEFDKSMQNLAGVMRVTRADLAGLEKTIIAVAGASVRTSNEVAKLAESLATLGKSKSEIEDLLKPVIDLSLGLDAPADEAGEFLVQMLNTFGKSTDSASEFADTIATIRTSTTLDFQKMRDSFQYIAPIANVLGKDLAYTGSVVGILADNGLKAESAGRLLSTALIKLATTGKTLDQALKEINDAYKEGATELEILSIANDLFGKQSAKVGAILALNTEAIELNAQAIRDNGGALDDLVNQQLESLDAKIKILDSSYERLILNMDNGQSLMGGAVKFALDQLTFSMNVLDKASTNSGNALKALFGIFTFNSQIVKSASEDLKELQVTMGSATKAINDQNEAYIKMHGSLGPLTQAQQELIDKQEKINKIFGFGGDVEVRTLTTINEEIKKYKDELYDIDVSNIALIRSTQAKITALEKEKDAILGINRAGKGIKERVKDREKEVAGLQQMLDLLEKIQANQLRVSDKLKADALEALKNTTANTDALEKQNEVLQKQQGILNKKAQDEQYAADMIKGAFISLGAELGIQSDTISNLFDDIRSGFKDTESSISSFTALFQDALSAFTAASNRRTQERLDMLKKEHDISIAFAGDSAAAKGAIEERYQRQVAQAKEKQARNERTAAIISAIMNTASAVVKTLAQLGFPAGIPASLIVGALGAAQTAIIARQPIPKFKEGVRDFEGGQAIVGDGGKREPITDKEGRLIGISPNRSTLVNLPKGANVFKDEDTFNKELNSILGRNAINPIGNAITSPVIMMGAASNGMDEAAMRRALKATLGMMPVNNTTIDKDGIKTFSQKQYSKGQSLNNRVTRKGISV